MREKNVKNLEHKKEKLKVQTHCRTIGKTQGHVKQNRTENRKVFLSFEEECMCDYYFFFFLVCLQGFRVLPVFSKGADEFFFPPKKNFFTSA